MQSSLFFFFLFIICYFSYFLFIYFFSQALTHPSYVEAYSAHSDTVRACYSKVGSLLKSPLNVKEPFRRLRDTGELLEVMDKSNLL